jgi:hypothetical protein
MPSERKLNVSLSMKIKGESGIRAEDTKYAINIKM